MSRFLLAIFSVGISVCFLADAFAESRLESYKPVVARTKAPSRTISQISNPFSKGINTSSDDDKGHVSFLQFDCFSGTFLPTFKSYKFELFSGKVSLSFRYLSLPPPAV
ncbi:hypothetical protein EHQ12_18435 [Leptospira gomenensis]|uniref:Uncharacterized protein n=1 Tax=Leptospira gomenensis TaxID=2484974 RepID=A0A5F1YQE3_9LEPT|nr:hypothetical protein [Leptospira gomenensis]TGK32588.1 hypothetical protein EHQ12_18435 [Leptospira gomenensis]TGK38319.1 hypothetical protein EHQ17_01310 [Leptospira gomenensis]TGK52133.1 hypothetical protein EHQ07_00735 [Leptospira gomenensis]TGK59818.1 hypothetical protein EHQ13_11320 [Leptospira gomenensis]